MNEESKQFIDAWKTIGWFEHRPSAKELNEAIDFLEQLSEKYKHHIVEFPDIEQSKI